MRVNRKTTQASGDNTRVKAMRSRSSSIRKRLDTKWATGGFRLRLRFSPVRDRHIVEDLSSYTDKDRAERVKEMLSFAYSVQQILGAGGALGSIGAVHGQAIQHTNQAVERAGVNESRPTLRTGSQERDFELELRVKGVGAVAKSGRNEGGIRVVKVAARKRSSL